jgi:peptide/nickel transport system substrate-binding protein
MNRTPFWNKLLAALSLGWVLLAGAASAQPDTRPDVVVAVNELARGLEPVEQLGTVDVRITYSVYDTLIRRDFSVPGGGPASLRPSLATSWKRIDARTLELKLRAGVKWHDGSEFSADDVVFTFSPERLTGPNAVIPDGRNYFGHLQAVEKVDSLTVRFISREPDVVLEQRLASYAAWIVSSRQWLKFRTADANWMRAALREIRWNPIGTGPLKFKEWRKDQFIAFTAHDAYFGGRPNFKSVTFREVPELATRMAGVASGEFDIIVDVTPDQLPTLARYKDIETQSVVLENSHLLVFNMNAPALKDKRLRQALSLAIDRDKLRKALWGGRNFTPNGFQLPSFGAMHDPKRAGWAFDPQRARQLVKESGYDGKALSYRVIPNFYLNGVEAAQVLVEMWKAVGINVKLELVENFRQVRAAGMEIHPWSMTYRFPDPAGSLSVVMGDTSPMQTTWKFFNAPPAYNGADTLVNNSASSTVRQAAFRTMLDIIEDEVPFTALYNPLVSYASKRKLQWQAYPQFFMDFRPDVFKTR